MLRCLENISQKDPDGFLYLLTQKCQDIGITLSLRNPKLLNFCNRNNLGGGKIKFLSWVTKKSLQLHFLKFLND